VLALFLLLSLEKNNERIWKGNISLESPYLTIQKLDVLIDVYFL
jgi:hypothetical protein